MRFMASLYVSDVMDQIACTVEVQGWYSQFGPPEVMCQRTVVMPGIGETDPLEWTSRALTAVALDLTTPVQGRGGRALPMGDTDTISGIGQGS